MQSRYLIQTPRLRAREFDLLDVRHLMQMHRDPRVRALLVDDEPLDDFDTAFNFILTIRKLYRLHEGLGIWFGERFVQPVQSSGASQTPANWQFCGWFNMMPVYNEPRSGEIGCRLITDAWGTGIPMEIAEALLQHAFGQLNLHKVIGHCHPNNRSVQLILRAMSFTAFGEKPFEGLHEPQLSHYFEIDRPTWELTRFQPVRQRMREALKDLRNLKAADD
jgi:RimJ/RimL family protein N-acetyltransferase